MKKTVLWIDDSREEREAGRCMLERIGGITPLVAASSTEAQDILESTTVHAVVTDILRRRPNRSISDDDGYRFFREYMRSRQDLRTLPVVFHTKNLPSTFETDDFSQYLSKWDPQAKKAIELEVRLHNVISLYEAYADFAAWSRIEPRLVEVNSTLLTELRRIDDIWALTPDQFEQLVAELLEKIGYSVLWVPGGKDQGIDVIATSDSRDFLIDVKRYRADRPVSVELVRRVYGVAESLAPDRPGRILQGGIITSSKFTKEADLFRHSVRQRLLLRDGDWLKTELSRYGSHLS